MQNPSHSRNEKAGVHCYPRRTLQILSMLPQSKRTRAVVILTILTAFWGTTFSIVQNALDDVSPVLFAAIRFVLSLGIFLSISKDSRKGVRILFSPKNANEKHFRKQALIIGSS